jgi:nucleotide-binding universal stress UspA family protein
MTRIMFATDFSERTDRALGRAVILARAYGALPEIVHVVDHDRPRRMADHEVNDARQLLGKLARSLKDLDDVSCSTQIMQDNPFAGTVKAVARLSLSFWPSGRIAGRACKMPLPAPRRLSQC